jgi:uncharacterized protein YkwD
MKKLCIAFIFFFTTACRKSDEQVFAPTLPPMPLEPLKVPPPAPEPSEQNKIIFLVNAERSKKGLSSVRANAKLMEAAQKYAELMASRSQLSHTIDGDVSGRVNAVGYRWKSVGENIAWNYDDAVSVVAGWMDSTGHRRNILTPGFSEIGVGIATNSRGEHYHCQVFATPAGQGLLPLIRDGRQPEPSLPTGYYEPASGQVIHIPEEWTTTGGTAASSVAIHRW